MLKLSRLVMLLGNVFHILGAANKKQLSQAFLEVNIYALLQCAARVNIDLLMFLDIDTSIKSSECTHLKYWHVTDKKSIF